MQLFELALGDLGDIYPGALLRHKAVLFLVFEKLHTVLHCGHTNLHAFKFMLLNGMVLKVLVRRHYLSKGLKQVKRRPMWIFQGEKKTFLRRKMEDGKSSDGVYGEGEIWTSWWLLGRLTGRQLTSVCVLAVGCRGYRAGRRWRAFRRGSLVRLLAELQETR